MNKITILMKPFGFQCLHSISRPWVIFVFAACLPLDVFGWVRARARELKKTHGIRSDNRI